MNKHVKMAFMVAPFLAIFGFVGADYYEEALANEEKLIELTLDGHCDVLSQINVNQNCVLKSKDFKINISDEAGITSVNANFPLDSATFFLVDKNNQMSAFPLGMKKSPYYWRSETPLRTLIANKGDSYKLRLIAKIKGGQYIAEFYTQTL
jgi:hypothetical protein